MSDEDRSWAPFGPSEDDQPTPAAEPSPEPERTPEPEPSPEPEPTPEPPVFAPPVAGPLPSLPDPVGTAGLGWPAPPHNRPPAPAEPPPDALKAPWPPAGYQQPARVPSSATVALVLGIVSVAFCGFAGPFAIHYATRARREIDSDPALGGRGLATWGLALGIVSTSVLVLLVLLLLFIAVGIIAI